MGHHKLTDFKSDENFIIKNQINFQFVIKNFLKSLTVLWQNGRQPEF